MKKHTQSDRPAGESFGRRLDDEARFFRADEHSNRWLVFAIGLVSPGLAWALRGRIGIGVLVNLALVMAWFAFALFWVVEKFYPYEPFLIFLTGWFILVVLAAWDASKRSAIASSGTSIVFLVTMFVCSWLIPFASVYKFTRDNVAEVVRVDSPEMLPTLIPGDGVFIDKHVYRISRPRPGDVVYYAHPRTGEATYGRVLAVEGEIVSIVQRAIYVSGMSVGHSPISGAYAVDFKNVTGVDARDLNAQFETNGNAVYWISEPGMASESALEPGDWFVRERELFVLNDNRAVMNDSRVHGPISLDNVIGMPVFVMGNRSAQQAQILRKREDRKSVV